MMVRGRWFTEHILWKVAEKEYPVEYAAAEQQYYNDMWWTLFIFIGIPLIIVALFILSAVISGIIEYRREVKAHKIMFDEQREQQRIKDELFSKYKLFPGE